MYELPLLTLVIWLPIIGGIAVLASGDKASLRHLQVDRARSSRS
jgi:hypothetical protein